MDEKSEGSRNKFARWIFELETINYLIQYRKAQENGAMGYLSREGWRQYLDRHIYNVEESATSLRDQIRCEQLTEVGIRKAIGQLESTGVISSGAYNKQEGTRIDESEGFYRKCVVVEPREMQMQVVEMVHRITHAGTDRCLESIRERFFWPKM